ncbi:MAG: hypothetical protein QOF51_2461 [Chloroflexota bacterium]|nr:hypothetical protein [Chloroflexota bacterium]
MPKVELGIHTGQQDVELDELRRLWRHCDQAGFDLITVWDHFYESPYVDGNSRTYETIPVLTTLALDTARSRIGVLCFGMGYRNPALLAKSLTTIDHLSGGLLTVGRGAHQFRDSAARRLGCAADVHRQGHARLPLIRTVRLHNSTASRCGITAGSMLPIETARSSRAHHRTTSSTTSSWSSSFPGMKSSLNLSVRRTQRTQLWSNEFRLLETETS